MKKLTLPHTVKMKPPVVITAVPVKKAAQILAELAQNRLRFPHIF